MQRGDCCTAGKIAYEDHKPQGRFGKLGPLAVYETSPALDTSNILLYCPDGFGHALHNLFLADRFADQGWHVIIPDYYEGDPVPLEHLDWDQSAPLEKQGWTEDQIQKMKKFNLDDWLEIHNMDKIELLLKQCVYAIQQTYPQNPMTLVGYCTGGKQGLRLASSSAIKAAALFHPSFTVEKDTEGIQVPLYIGLAGNDRMVSPTLRKDLERWLAASEVRNYIFMVYPGMDHGFTVRPDNNNPEIRNQCKKALDDAVLFLHKFKQ